MIIRLLSATRAELIKLGTLPAVLGTMAGTVLVMPVLTVALARTGHAAGLPATAYAQAGPILLGVLAGAGEYTGGRMRTTLLAVPDRRVLLAGKTLACLAMAALTALLAVTAAGPFAGCGVPTLLGAAAYLVAMGLFGFEAALLLRRVVAALVSVLGLVFVVSPLLAGVTAAACYLPDRAGAFLYGAAPGGGTAAAVLAGWLVFLLGAAGLALAVRDA
ncbi:hypothetical protein ORV05_20785 [Amycolatopsis cynarae]|uniref:ABC transporter permease n=1 Tax=Amycolatopsis cynarae TaxID=2995223 RepID=A0ABY7AU23_9PSEU|nr:hypothetical protein [Amycolatopsis sp. HUAS 11-8]WAL63450.1 hypothetical protein ORV05_20785 [Amycolatopsis sp. HUAS 11-8]